MESLRDVRNVVSFESVLQPREAIAAIIRSHLAARVVKSSLNSIASTLTNVPTVGHGEDEIRAFEILVSIEISLRPGGVIRH